MEKMNPNDYLFRSLEDKNQKYYETYEKYTKNEIITFIMFLGFSIASLASLIIAFPFALATGSIAGLIAIHKYKSFKEFHITENRIEKEKNHLKKLLDETPDVDERLMDKRRSKISSLSIKKMKATKSYFDANDITSLTYASTIIGSFATVINPSYVWIPILGIIGTIAAANNEIKKHIKNEYIENRINNLECDLELIDLITDDNGKLIYGVKKLDVDSSMKKTINEEYIENESKEIEHNKILKKVR